jgi:glycine/D-amino acid oxidase-like deaminating enzyme
MQVDFLIIGQGLAGSLLARACHALGARVLVVDNHWRSAASQVAAGLMTPLTGKRFTLMPDYPKLFAKASEVFTKLGVFQPQEVYRLFVDAEQRQRAQRRMSESDCQPFLAAWGEPGYQHARGLTDVWGGVMLRGAWVQLPKFLAETRAWLSAQGALLEADFSTDQWSLDHGAVQWQGIRARGIVFCDGYKSSQQGPFKYLPWRPAKGEALDVTADFTQPPFIINRDGWALPLGEQRWRTGTNWAWDELGEIPTEAQREKLLARFRGFFAQAGKVEVTAHVAGVRPCTADNHPFLGTHPQHSPVHLFNGIGPRGTVWAPALAEHMADYLLKQQPLDSAIDLRRINAPSF